MPTTRYTAAGGVSENSVMDAIWSVYAVVSRSASTYKISLLAAVMCPCSSAVHDGVEQENYSHSIVPIQSDFSSLWRFVSSRLARIVPLQVSIYPRAVLLELTWNSVG